MSVTVSTHPLVKHKLALLRDKNTDHPVFRQLVGELAQLLFFEATTDFQMTTVMVKTPLADCRCEVIWERLGILPILRAGLGMAEAILPVLPKASVWHLGLYRDHQTHQPIVYYNKLPAQPNIDMGFVVDPMLATGGSVIEAVNILKKWGLPKIKFIGLIAAPEGVAALEAAHPDVPIHLGVLIRIWMRICTSFRVWEMRVIGNSEPDRKTAIRAPADLLCLVNGWYDNQPIVSRQETVQGGSSLRARRLNFERERISWTRRLDL